MAKKYRVTPNRKVYIALRHTRESRRCVNREESEEENTRHHQPASSWLRNSQTSVSVPRKHSAGDSKSTLVSGSDPFGPEPFLTSDRHRSLQWGYHGEHNMFCVLLGHIRFYFKTTVVSQLFPCEGITFPSTKAHYFLSAACTPLQHLPFPRGPWLCACSRKGLPCSTG